MTSDTRGMGGEVLKFPEGCYWYLSCQTVESYVSMRQMHVSRCLWGASINASRRVFGQDLIIDHDRLELHLESDTRLQTCSNSSARNHASVCRKPSVG